MKVLWITSRPLVGTCGTSKSASSGSWLDAAYDSCKGKSNLVIDVASLGKVSEVQSFVDGNSTFYLLPGGNDVDYDIRSSRNIQCWNRLKELTKPDIIQIWGTEKSYYLLARRVFKDTPCVVYIQGVITKIAEEYCAGLSSWTVFKNTSLQDIYRGTWIKRTQRHFMKMAECEKELLNSSEAVILENDWCEYQINAIASGRAIYRSKLPIKDVFFNVDWDINKVTPHTIFTNAGAAPIKGHHILFKALGIIKHEFPDVQVLIPGFSRMSNSWKDKLARNGYSNYLRKLIRKYQLGDNVQYVGVLDAEGMAEMISKANVFVMPSCIENHSSSLIEAMVVGAPCVSSFVGGVGSVAMHNQNALLYNFPDAEALAGLICRVLRERELAISLSDEAKKIRAERIVDLGEDFSAIYSSMIENEN